MINVLRNIHDREAVVRFIDRAIGLLVVFVVCGGTLFFVSYIK